MPRSATDDILITLEWEKAVGDIEARNRRNVHGA